MAKENIRFLKYQKFLLQGKSHYQAAIKAGYSKSYARKVSSEETKQRCPKKSLKMSEALEKQGITPDYLAAKLKQGLNANETKYATGYIEKIKKVNGKDLKMHEGIFSDKREVTAWNARKDYEDMAHRIRGDYLQDKHELIEKTGFEDVTDEALDKEIENLKRKLKRRT